MKLLTVILLLSCSPVYAFSQIDGIGEARLNTLDGWKLRVENQGSTPIVAMHAIFRCPATNGHGRWDLNLRFDHLFNYGSDQPVPPGRFVAFPITAQASACPGGIDAALFADGHSVGDTAAVADIYGRRQGVSEAITFSQQALERVRIGASPAKDMAALINSRSREIAQDVSRSAAERSGATYAFSVVAGLLEAQQDWSVPSNATAHRQPTVESLIKDTGLQQEQAHATVIKKKLEEWSTDLQGSLQPPPGK